MLRHRLSLALLALIVAAFVAPPSAARTAVTRPAAATPTNPILFTTDRHGAAEIYSIRPDGTNSTRVTNNTCNDTDVSWSADAQRILFASDCGGNYDIYSMKPDGTDRRRLTTDTRHEHLPAQSPDGQYIALILEEAAGSTHLYVMNSDGTGAHRITHTAGVEENRPSWSPDGKRIAYCSTASGGYRVWTVNADGSDPVQVRRDKLRSADLVVDDQQNRASWRQVYPHGESGRHKSEGDHNFGRLVAVLVTRRRARSCFSEARPTSRSTS